MHIVPFFLFSNTYTADKLSKFAWHKKFSKRSQIPKSLLRVIKRWSGSNDYDTGATNPRFNPGGIATWHLDHRTNKTAPYETHGLFYAKKNIIWIHVIHTCLTSSRVNVTWIDPLSLMINDLAIPVKSGKDDRVMRCSKTGWEWLTGGVLILGGSKERSEKSFGIGSVKRYSCIHPSTTNTTSILGCACSWCLDIIMMVLDARASG